MTIKRQYSLPYCTLTLEGMSGDASALGQLEQRPLLSILLNAECRFSHTAQFLKGDRTFFTSLVQAVGRYAQEFLSGIRHPQLDKDVPEIVQLAATEDKNIHRLTWNPTAESTESTNNGATATNNSGKSVAIDLTTVQLFDLVDAVDQFLADSRTLPELSVPLQPVSKRYRQAEVPASERLLPPAIGIGSLALAAALFALIPVPEVTEPEVTNQESQLEKVTPESEDTEDSPLSGEPENSTDDGETESLSTDTEENPEEETPEDELAPTSDAENSDSREKEEETESPEDQQSNNSSNQEGEDSTEDQEDEQTSSNPRSIAVSSRNRNEEDSTSPRSSSNTSSNSNNRTRSRQASTSSEEIRAALASATEITEPNELYYIQKYVRNQILDQWDSADDLSRDLEYRVSVARDGTILDYEPINGTSSGSNSLTPLPDLSYRSTDGNGVRQEEIAKLRVVFTENGVVEISPWRGFTSQPNFASDITDGEKLDELEDRLRRLIHEFWDGDVSYSRGLQYRIAVTEDGKIADYSFLNSAAGANLDETPLERLLEPEAAGIGTRESNSVIPQAPLAHFQVVFKPNGVLEIAPW